MSKKKHTKKETGFKDKEHQVGGWDDIRFYIFFGSSGSIVFFFCRKSCRVHGSVTTAVELGKI